MTHTMREDARPFLLKSNAYQTYANIRKYHPKSGEQRIEILEKVDDLDPNDIDQYVKDAQAIQAELIRIGPDRKYHEFKPPAFLTRLLDHLNDDQKDKIHWLRNYWRSCDEATYIDCFQVAIQLKISLRKGGSQFASVAYDKGKNKKGVSINDNPCG